MQSHASENLPLFVVILAEDLVITEVKSVAYAKSVIALLTSEAFQVVDIGPRAHHHLERWDDFAACRAMTGISEKSQIVSFAENKIGFGVERRANFAESAVAASTFQAVFVPVHVQRFQEVSLRNRLSATRAFLLSGTVLARLALAPIHSHFIVSLVIRRKLRLC